jgi:hypothetical protein
MHFSGANNRAWLAFVVTILSIRAAPIEAQCIQLDNQSQPTLCAEEDNIKIYLTSPGITNFRVSAFDPGWWPLDSNCPPDFTNCDPNDPNGYPFTPDEKQLYDDTVWWIRAFREAEWWLPQGMTATGPLGTLEDSQRIEIGKQLGSGWPSFFVLYADGYMRLIPHPPDGSDSVCYGSSVIIGPVVEADRPLAQISAVMVDVDAADQLALVDVEYTSGGSALLRARVDQTQATVDVFINYPTDGPFAAFRSMFVAEDNCDAARARVHLGGTVVLDSLILDPNFPELVTGDQFFFYRTVESEHNQSAPDILIGQRLGDLNCDGCVDFADINPFVTYLSNFDAWQLAFPCCDPLNGDIDQDGTFGQGSFGDINPFVQLLSTGQGPCPYP